MSAAGPLIAVGLLLLFGGGGKKKKKAIVIPPAGILPLPNMPPQPAGPTGPVQVLDDITAPTPTVGMLYQVRAGDNPWDVAKAALGPGASNTDIANYLRILPRSRWNWMKYATSNSGAYGVRYHADQPPSQENPTGFIAAAFLPHNDSVQAATEQGELPYRRYQWKSNPNTAAPIRVNGAATHGATAHGRLFLRPFGDMDGDAPENNPMPLLDALGVTLADLTPHVGA